MLSIFKFFIPKFSANRKIILVILPRSIDNYFFIKLVFVFITCNVNFCFLCSCCAFDEYNCFVNYDACCFLFMINILSFATNDVVPCLFLSPLSALESWESCFRFLMKYCLLHLIFYLSFWFFERSFLVFLFGCNSCKFGLLEWVSLGLCGRRSWWKIWMM